MKTIKVNGIKKRLNINSKILKKESDIVGDVEFNVGLEILKFVILTLIAAAFFMLHYQSKYVSNDDTNAQIVRKAYLYTFGIAAGDLMVVLLAGAYFTLIVRWLGHSLKNYYFKWFKPYTYVDYWLLKRRVIIFVWLSLLFGVLIYHNILVTQRVDNIWYYNSADCKKIFSHGWYYSFTNQSFREANPKSIVNYPVAYGNVGIFIDSILNVLYCISFGPYLALILAGFIFAYAWLKLVTIKPKEYFANLNEKKKTLIMIEKYLVKIKSLFYYTQDVKYYFAFMKDAAEALKIDYTKVNFYYLRKQVEKNIHLLATNTSTSKYFINVVHSKSKAKIEEENFLKNIESKTPVSPAADLVFSGTNAATVANYNYKGDRSKYISAEATSAYSADFDLTNSKIEENEIKTNDFVNSQNNVKSSNTTARDINNLFEQQVKEKQETIQQTIVNTPADKDLFNDSTTIEESKNEFSKSNMVPRAENEMPNTTTTSTAFHSQELSLDEAFETRTMENDAKSDSTKGETQETTQETTKTQITSPILETPSKTQEVEVPDFSDFVRNATDINTGSVDNSKTIGFDIPEDSQETTAIKDVGVQEQEIQENAKTQTTTSATTPGFIIPEDSQETKVDEQTIESIEQKAQEETQQVNPNTNFRFGFDTGTIEMAMIEEQKQTQKQTQVNQPVVNAKSEDDDDDSWISPILSDN